MNKLKLNTITPLILELITIISGFILPRMILSHYGSDVNGLVSSITQFLAIIGFFEAGVGTVIKYNLYGPLERKDNKLISEIVVSSNKFFHKLSYGFCIYAAILVAIFPLLSNSNFDFFSTAFLIVAMFISTFAQYYFGMTNTLLLTADEKGYIQYTAQILSVAANTIICVFLIYLGASIQVVKLASSIIFLFKPLFLQHYVNKHYLIDYKIKYSGEPIKQKWNGLAQHISAVVLDGTDVIVLTLFSTMSNISIYSVYNMIVYGIKKLLTSGVSGVEAKMGNLIAKNDRHQILHFAQIMEWSIHNIAIFLYGCTAILLVPFIQLYTNGINDADYYQPVFALLLTLANMGHALRLPYSILILTAGHYKQTQKNYISAAGINILLSIVLVIKHGLVGVAIGTIVAMIYQTIWMAWYAYKKILDYPIYTFLKQILFDVVAFISIYIVRLLFDMTVSSYFDWFVKAAILALISVGLLIILNIIFYRENIFAILTRITKRRGMK